MSVVWVTNSLPDSHGDWAVSRWFPGWCHVDFSSAHTLWNLRERFWPLSCVVISIPSWCSHKSALKKAESECPLKKVDIVGDIFIKAMFTRQETRIWILPNKTKFLYLPYSFIYLFIFGLTSLRRGVNWQRFGFLGTKMVHHLWQKDHMGICEHLAFDIYVQEPVFGLVSSAQIHKMNQTVGWVASSSGHWGRENVFKPLGLLENNLSTAWLSSWFPFWIFFSFLF